MTQLSRLAGLLYRTLDDWPVASALLGAVLGALLAGTALAVDAATGWDLVRAAPGGVRIMFGALVTGAVTATAVLFWVRGMLVQLAASEISPRVLRGYLDDRYLHVAFGLLAATFGHAVVGLLWLPPPGDEPASALTSISGGVLGVLSLLLIVHAVHHSARATNPSRMLARVTAETLESIYHLHPSVGEDGSLAERVGERDGGPESAVVAPSTGWMTRIDDAQIAAYLPPGGLARLLVHEGDFVTAGSPLAMVAAADAELEGERIAAAFRVEQERDLERGVETGLDALMAMTTHSLSSSTADRATAAEALRCLSVVLDALLRREPFPSVRRFSDDRIVARRMARSHRDVLRVTIGELYEIARSSHEFSEQLFHDLDRLVARLRGDGFDERAALLREELARVAEG